MPLTKNYKKGGNKWVIGGELNVVTGGKITPNSGTIAATIPTPTDLPTALTAITALRDAIKAVGITL